MTNLATQREVPPKTVDEPGVGQGVADRFGDGVQQWLAEEKGHGTVLAEEMLWQEAYLRYLSARSDVPEDDRASLWTSLAAQLVFEAPGTPRNEQEAAREAVASVLGDTSLTPSERARSLNVIADRWNVERTKLLALLAPGVGYPWMFARSLWTTESVGASLHALFAAFDWKDGETPDAAWLREQVTVRKPDDLLSHLAERAPEDSDLHRMLVAIADWARNKEHDGKDLTVSESYAFLDGLQRYGLSGSDVDRLRSPLLALRNALVLVASFQLYHAAEQSVLLSEELRESDLDNAAVSLTRALNVYQRLCVAQMYPDRLLNRYYELCREMEELRAGSAEPDTRRQHVLLVTTMNSPPDLQRLLLSVTHELMHFAYGPTVHVIVSDDSSQAMRDENARLIEQARRSGLSISHWDLDQKNAFLDQLNAEVFPDGECDVWDLAGIRKPGEKGVPYGRFRNFLRLVALKEVRERGVPDPIFTWLDQDNEIGALVLTKSGALSKRHVFNYFQQKSELFDDPDLRVGGGGYTNDALEGVEKFWVAWGILHHVFDLAQNHAPDEPPVFTAEADITRFRPWDQADTLERLRREGEDVETISDQILLLLSTLVGTFRGKYDNQVQIYHPWTYGYVEPGEERMVEETRPFAGMPGGNTTFAPEVLASPVPFITVGGRGEDIFHLWQIESEHGPGSVRLTHTPALHTRNVREGRSDLMTEIIDSYNGRIFREPALIWAALGRLANRPVDRTPEQVEADTAAYIENLRNEAKASIAAVAGFAAALEPYLDESNDYWWLRRAEVDPRYGTMLTKLRGMAAEFKDADKYQRLADEKLLSLEDVKRLTDEFVAAYPHWRTVVEHVGGISSSRTGTGVGGAQFEGYSAMPPAGQERKPSFIRAATDPPMLVEPTEEPAWREVLFASLSLFRKFEEGRANSDSLMQWDQRVGRLEDIYRHYVEIVDEVPPFVWTRLYRDALLIPHSAPYAAVTRLLTDDLAAASADVQEEAVARLEEELGVNGDLMRQALRAPATAPAAA